MNKRQKIKHLQALNAKHIEARLELSKALNSAIQEKDIADRRFEGQLSVNKNFCDMIEELQCENERLNKELNKPLLSRLWRWNK